MAMLAMPPSANLGSECCTPEHDLRQQYDDRVMKELVGLCSLRSLSRLPVQAAEDAPGRGDVQDLPALPRASPITRLSDAGALHLSVCIVK
jgi:hypothetical protein